MSRKFRISLEDKLLPVQIFFNAIPDRFFVETLEAFECGVGSGFNDAFCEFPGDQEFDEQPLNGIGFFIKDEEVVLSYNKFIFILQDVCNAYIEENPLDKDIVAKHLVGIKKRLNIL